MKNRYGADAGLHFYKDKRQIYGNFSIAGWDYEIVFKDRLVGIIPEKNKKWIAKGVVFRFAARTWVINKVEKRTVIVSMTKRAPEVQVKFGGSSVYYDFVAVNNIINCMQQAEMTKDIFTTKSQGEEFVKVSNYLQMISQPNTILAYKVDEGIKHITLAGKLINEIIPVAQDLDVIEFDDFSFTTKREFDFSQLQTSQDAYLPYWRRRFELPPDASLFQMMLPQSYQYKEFVQQWTKDTVIEKILKRLQASKVVRKDDLRPYFSESILKKELP